MDEEMLTTTAKGYLPAFGSTGISAWGVPLLHDNLGKARKGSAEAAAAKLVESRQVCEQMINGGDAARKIRPPRRSNRGAP